MLKVMLSISMLLGFNYLQSNFRVDKILYDCKDSINSQIVLKIELFSKIEDIIEMRIYFCDEEKNYLNNNYYSSVLRIEGSQKTIAKIPYKLKEKNYLNIHFFVNDAKDEIFDIYFPIYPSEDSVCTLSSEIYCESQNPSLVTYENNIIKEEKSKLFLINEETTFYSFHNTVPINKIRISSNNFDENGYATLYILNEIYEFKLDYNSRYIIPLEMVVFSNIVSFSFENGYYLDLVDGYVYDRYVVDTVYKKQIIFPYVDNTYSLYIEMIDCFSHFSKVRVYFDVVVEGDLIGRCNESKYCLRRVY